MPLFSEHEDYRETILPRQIGWYGIRLLHGIVSIPLLWSENKFSGEFSASQQSGDGMAGSKLELKAQVRAFSFRSLFQ